MKISNKSFLNGPRGLIKRTICCMTAAGLVAAFMPAAAFAAAGSSENGGWYDLPTEAIGSFQHKGTDSKGNTYTYSYLSSGIERVVGGFSQSMYYIMGINGVNFDRGLRNGSPWENVSEGKLTTNHVTAVDGIMGTSVNSQPDEYLWNSCVIMSDGTALYTDTESGDSTSRSTVQEGKAVHINNGNVTSYETIAATVNGTEYDIPVVIYDEANFISKSDNAWGTRSIADWVEIENQREGRPNEGTYDPYTATWTTASGGINYGTQLIYELAAVVDEVTDDSRDSNGNATVMSRYVDANGTGVDKYASATELAQRYEDFAKATQYYMIEQFNKGVEKKVTAVVCGYQPATDTTEAAYACRIYDPQVTGLDNNSANFGGRLANSVMNISTDINEVLTEKDVAFTAASGEGNYVRWYYASDIVKNADAVFVTDVPYGNNITSYLAQNSNGDRLSIYSVDNTNYVSQNENVNPLVNAAAAESAKADVFYKYPSHLFGVWYAQGFENCWMAPIAASYMYPDTFTSVENVMAYAAKNFWHINSSDVNGVVDATCYDISMPKGKKFGTPVSNYQSILDDIMAEGNQYYFSSSKVMKSVNSLNCGDLETYDYNARLALLSAGTDNTETIASMYAAVVETLSDQVSDGELNLSDANKQISTLTTTLSETSNDLNNTRDLLKTAQSQLSEANGATAALKAELAKASKTSITVNVSTVNAKAVAKAIKAAGADKKYITSVTVGKKAKKISSKAFASLSKATTLTVKSTKLTKKNVKNSLKGSKITVVNVPSKKKTAYTKIFKKSNSGKKVKIA